MKGLSGELYMLILVYIFTLMFAFYNIYAYLWKQQRYRTWLVTFFYILAIIVLTTRLAQYMFSIYLNTLLIDKEHLLEKSEEEAFSSDFTHIVKTYRKIG